MNLWGRSQDAERWKIFRYNNLSHNTLVVNGQYQRVNGNAQIIRYSDESSFPHVVFDMSAVYEGQLAKSLRGAALLPTGQVIIQDEYKATNQPATVRWAMVTPAKVSIESNKKAVLQKEGKTLHFNVLTDEDTKLRTYSTEPKADYDARNPGTRLIGFEVSLSPRQEVRTAVLISPSSTNAKTSIDLKPLLQWSTSR
jgi:hypothetical protein